MDRVLTFAAIIFTLALVSACDTRPDYELRKVAIDNCHRDPAADGWQMDEWGRIKCIYDHRVHFFGEKETK